MKGEFSIYFDGRYQSFLNGFRTIGDTDEEFFLDQDLSDLEDSFIIIYDDNDDDYRIAQVVLYSIEHGYDSVLINIPNSWEPIDHSRFEIWPINFNDVRYTDIHKFTNICKFDGSHKSFQKIVDAVIAIKQEYEDEKQKADDEYDKWLARTGY